MVKTVNFHSIINYEEETINLENDVKNTMKNLEKVGKKLIL